MCAKPFEAPGEAKADWEIICELAGAMGKREFFDFQSPEEIWEEIRSVWKAGHGITYARLENGGSAMAVPNRGSPGHHSAAHEIFSERSARATEAS